MKDYGDEQTMVVSAQHLRVHNLLTEGVTFCDAPLAAILKHAEFKLRNDVEEDPTRKQIIPYVVFVCGDEHGDEVLSYTRGKSGGETRLIGKRSIGIGGHPNPVTGYTDMRLQYEQELMREVGEELGYDDYWIPMDRRIPTAYIYSEATPVNRVHLGCVHIFRTPKPLDLKTTEPCIANPEYLRVEDLQAGTKRYEELEDWSKLALAVLNIERRRK